MDQQKLIDFLWYQHRGKTVGVSIGAIFGLFVTIFGFWKMILLLIFMTIGYIIGQKVDDNLSFRDVMDRIFKDQ